jgi:ribosomal protein L32
MEYQPPRNRLDENHEKAKKFKALMMNMLEIITTLAENSNMSEEDYRRMCEDFMSMNKIVFEPDEEEQYNDDPQFFLLEMVAQTLERNEVMRSQTAIITNYAENQKKNQRTDEDKLKSGNYCICDKCGVVIRKSGKAEHQRTPKCWKARDEKKLSATTGKAETPEEAMAIIKIRSALRKSRNNRFIEN